jgi:hypothetical protein
MLRVRCPECGAETEVTPRYGGEVIAVYCLKHRAGLDRHARPVYMMRTSSEAVAVEPEPIAA